MTSSSSELKIAPISSHHMTPFNVSEVFSSLVLSLFCTVFCGLLVLLCRINVLGRVFSIIIEPFLDAIVFDNVINYIVLCLN